MSDRLNELERQRTLAQEQVAWFDREIARERGSVASPGAPTPARLATKPVALAAADESDAQAEQMIQRFQKTERPVKDDVRRGCFLYFFGAFLLLGLALVTFYLLRRPAE